MSVLILNSKQVLSQEILNDTRTVCIFCGCEGYVGDFNAHCGEAGAFLTRAEYINYTGEDHFADE